MSLSPDSCHQDSGALGKQPFSLVRTVFTALASVVGMSCLWLMGGYAIRHAASLRQSQLVAGMQEPTTGVASSAACAPKEYNKVSGVQNVHPPSPRL